MPVIQIARFILSLRANESGYINLKFKLFAKWKKTESVIDL